MIEQFKTLMREHCPDEDLSMSMQDNRFYSDFVQGMWVMYQICNAWRPAETMPIGEKVLLLEDGDDEPFMAWKNSKGRLGCGVEYVSLCSSYKWRPLPIPPLTTEGGV